MPNPVRRHRMGTETPFVLPEQASLKARWMSSLGTWQDTGLTTPAVADADPVGGWADQFGAFTATQATAGSRPTLKLNIFPTGKPGLLFVPASNSNMVADALGGTFTGTDLPFTVVAISQLTATGATGCHASLGRGASVNPFMQSVWTVTSALAIGRRNDGATTNLQGTSAVLTAKANLLPHSYIYVFDGTNGTIYLDGAQVLSPTALAVGADTFDRFTIGAFRRNEAGPTYVSHFPGYYGELAVYNAAITAASINKWAKYARSAYGAAYG